jgi:6-phosphofructokinase 1
VIRAIVRNLWYGYGVRRITGIRYGYRGFLPENNFPVLELNPENVDDIHKMGGTILGSSRGGSRISDIVDAIERMNLNILFPIGGDGTQRGALAIAEEIQRRGLKVAIVGVPKTIDNDLSFIQKSFGFETAVSEAVKAVTAAHVEADDAINGIGLVKVMGRESGFIAAHTTLASNDVNFVLIPEVPFDMEGKNGLLSHLKKRLENRGHAVVLVAEGAGQDLIPLEVAGTDASGNKKLGDIGVSCAINSLVFLNRKGWK